MKRLPFFFLWFAFLLLVVPAGAQEPVVTPIMIEPPIWDFDGYTYPHCQDHKIGKISDIDGDYYLPK